MEYVFHTGDPGHWTSVRIPRRAVEVLLMQTGREFVAGGAGFDATGFFGNLNFRMVNRLTTRPEEEVMDYTTGLWDLLYQGKPVYYTPHPATGQ